MTAAHCTNGKVAKDIEVKVGEHDLHTDVPGERWITVRRIHQGPYINDVCYNLGILNPSPPVQGDRSERQKPPIDRVPTAPAAGGPLLQQPTAQADWRNIPNLSQREIFTCLICHPVNLELRQSGQPPQLYRDAS